MKNIILFLFLIPTLAFCQQKKSTATVSRDSMINKWTKAVINIDCRRNTIWNEEDELLLEKFRKHEIDSATYFHRSDSLYYKNFVAQTGTAIFLKYKRQHYLITARHVIEDTAKGVGKVYPRIFLVHNYTNKYQGFTEPIMLMSLSTGPPSTLPYSFAPNGEDLGIISLNYRGRRDMALIGALYDRGYSPITIEDIDTACRIMKGENIMAVGFPSELADLPSLSLPVAYLNWDSPFVTLPVVSFGAIENELQGQNYLFGNIFIHHGNSGGPLVKNNKLVGVAVFMFRQPIKSGGDNLNAYFLEHNVFVKSSLVLPLLRQLEARLEDQR